MSKVKVLLNIRCLSSPTLRGISRYTKELLSNFPRQNMDLFLISDRDVCMAHLDGADYENLIIKKMNYFVWEQLYVPYFCWRNGIDIYHNPNNYGTPLLGNFKKLNTIHDVIDLHEKHSLSLKMKLYYWLTQNFASRVISVSEYSKQDTMSLLNIPGEKIKVIYEAGNLKKVPRMNVENTQKYFLYVGGWEGRKNISCLLQAFAKLRDSGFRLILAGEKNVKIFSEVESQLINLGIQEVVDLKSWVSDEELQTLYANAFCFVYPSLFEGFGLQLLEAMEFDIPVLCSNLTSLPEIHGLNEATFNPDNPGELADLMLKLIQDEVFQNDLKEHSRKRKQDFSWAKTAKKTEEYYASLI